MQRRGRNGIGRNQSYMAKLCILIAKVVNLASLDNIRIELKQTLWFVPIFIVGTPSVLENLAS